METLHIYILITAFLLDLALGDPRWLPHLIVLFGNAIAKGEKTLNKGNYRFAKGVLLTIGLVSITFVLPFLLFQYLEDFRAIYFLLATTLLFYCLANKTLASEGLAVFKALKEKGLEAGRQRVAWIVGRETQHLSEQQVRIATLETLSENLSDGVIAPLCYFFILGVPGAMAYKMINTFDSMIGYKNERYEQFGKFAAKLDDVANFLPARLTAIVMLLVAFKPQGIAWVWREGKKHSSPNAGYPEAALAYILNCRFGGPNTYHGKIVEKPYIGNHDRKIQHQEIHQVVSINYKSSILFIALGISILLSSFYAIS